MLQLYIWGLVVSSVVEIPTTLLSLRYIKKNDPEFLTYFENLTAFRKFKFFASALLKMTIPFFNIIYPFSFFTKVAKYGIANLTDIWQEKFYNEDENKQKIKENINKIKSHFDKKDESKKEDTLEKTKVANNKPVNNEKTEANKAQNKVQSDTTKNNKPTLIDYVSVELDRLNSSNLSNETLSNLYKQKYELALVEYEKNKTVENYRMLELIMLKYEELKQIRNNNHTAKR